MQRNGAMLVVDIQQPARTAFGLGDRQHGRLMPGRPESCPPGPISIPLPTPVGGSVLHPSMKDGNTGFAGRALPKSATSLPPHCSSMSPPPPIPAPEFGQAARGQSGRGVGVAGEGRPLTLTSLFSLHTSIHPK
mmetsp:Transcript_11716/g.28787  ORF Transcript_11716/g.28787 Transcript_11716/m.28787 type:complete len:134 (-) Transcript_11716:79-480(-)